MDQVWGTEMQIKINIRILHTMLKHIRDDAIRSKEEAIIMLQSP